MNRSMVFANAIFVAFGIASADDDMDKLLEQAAPANQPVSATFKSIHVVQSHSVETSGKGVLDLVISHQFGPLQNGPEGGFGLDMASIRLGVDYGFTDWLDLGLERSNNLGKPVDLFGKLRLLRQNTSGSVPLSATWLSMAFLETRTGAGLDYDLDWQRRFSSLHQLIVARKFSERISLQVSPTLVQRDLVPTSDDDGVAIGVGLAGRCKLTSRLALTAEVTPMLTGVNKNVDPEFGIGLDVETGGHVFQVRLSNSTWLSEDRLYTRTWNAPSLGFNLSRAFDL